MKKFIFWEGMPPFQGYLVVGVSCSVDDILNFIKKEKRDKDGWLYEAFYEMKDVLEDRIKTSNGFVAKCDKSLGSYILWLKDYDWKDWDTIETLIHELHHVVEFKSQWMGTETEMESKAHMHGHLFRKISLKLVAEIEKQRSKKKKK
jgi:hypothetical protein